MLAEIGRDIIYALRMLKKDVGFTAVAVLTLGLGIGANTTVFSLFEALFNFPIPADAPDRITFAYGENPSRGRRREGVSADDFLEWRREARSFEHLVALAPTTFNVAGGAEPVRAEAIRVSQDFFELMGRPPALGRSFRPEEMVPGSGRVVVLSYGFWQRQLGGNADILGRDLTIDGLPHTVVGIAPEGFRFLPATALWAPLALESGRAPRDDRSLLVMGRLREGVSAAEATVELSTIARRIEEAHPGTNAGWTARVLTVREDLISGSGFVMMVLYGAITAVLLIACANVANLLLSRATVREKEIALRAALGAGRLRVIRQLLTESVVLALVGGVLGLFLGVWGIQVVRNSLAPDPRVGFVAEEMALNRWVLGHAFVISLLTGAIFGVVPAFRASKPNLDETLREGARGASGGTRQGILRNGLVVAQIALALALLSAGGAVVWAFNHVYASDPGFNPRRLLTFRISLPESAYSDPDRMAAFERDARERLLRMPGARSVAATTALPLTLHPSVRTARVILEGDPEDVEDKSLNVLHMVVSSGYLDTMEMALLRGRAIGDEDTSQSLPVTVVSETMARRFWPDTDPVGRRLKLAAPGMETAWLTVVGVARDVQVTAHSLRFAGALPYLFLPFSQAPRREFSVAVRTDVDPLSLAPRARTALGEVDRTIPLADLATAEQVIERIDTQNRILVRILASLAVIALVLAGVGVYGVVSYTVGRRTREIGVRVALGAEPRNIMLAVLKQAAVLSGLGFVLGLGAALAFVRFLASELQGLEASSASGPLTFAAVSVILLAVAQVASFVPALRAVRIDPVAALRNE